MHRRQEEGAHHACAGRLSEFAIESQNAFQSVKGQEQRYAVDDKQQEKPAGVRPYIIPIGNVNLRFHADSL